MKIYKKAFFILAFIMTVSVANAFDGGKKETKKEDTGIQFTSGSWSEILKKAKAEKKLYSLMLILPGAGRANCYRKMFLHVTMWPMFSIRILST